MLNSSLQIPKAYKSFCNSGPFNYSILDDFSDLKTLERIQSELLSSTNWIDKKIYRSNGDDAWIAHQMFLDTRNTTIISQLSKEIISTFGSTFGFSELCNSWAIISSNVKNYFPHCDGGIISLNWWVDIGCNKLSKELGGLTLFDVKRTKNMEPEAYASELGGCVKYVKEHSKGNLIEIEYRTNRAVIFDAFTFHSTVPFEIPYASLEDGRLNLTFTFK